MEKMDGKIDKRTRLELPEFIVCSAILTNERGKEVLGGVEFVTGYRHHDIFRAFNYGSESLIQRGPMAQGFMTSTGRFVSREEALEIYRKDPRCSDLIRGRISGGELFSEDLY